MPDGFLILTPLVAATIGVQLYNLWQARCLRQEYEALLYAATQQRYPEQT